MNNARESESERITRQSKDILDKNGFSFQRSVEEAVKKISKEWIFYGSEIPVATRGKNTHIDLVFVDQSQGLYLIGECKRVQAGFADWVFVKTPATSRKDKFTPLILDNLQESRSIGLAVVKRVLNFSKDLVPDVYGLGFRIKKNLKTAEVECQDSYDTINKSIEQVLRSTSGFINELSYNIRPNHETNYTWNYYFLPVIFTNANLWVTDDNIGKAALETGNLSELEAVRQVPYVWFSYNRPRELSPEFRQFVFNYNQPFALQTQAPFGNILKDVANYGKHGFEYEEFTRSVLIVNSSNLAQIDGFNKTFFKF